MRTEWEPEQVSPVDPGKDIARDSADTKQDKPYGKYLYISTELQEDDEF